MSDTENKGSATPTEATPSGKPGSWDAGQKLLLMQKVIHQLQGDGKISIKWAEIDMPGRTSKSLTHAWAKIQAEIKEVTGGAPAAVKPKTTPRKKKADADGGSPTPAKKRKSTLKKKAVKKSESDEEMDAPVQESDGDEKPVKEETSDWA